MEETESNELVKQIEAVLFAAARAVTKEELKDFCKADESAIEKAIKELDERLKKHDSAMMLTPESGGWKLAVREKYTAPLQNIVPNTELNKAVLETLAVIAWKQPVLQSEVIKIRTTNAYEHIAELEELGFVVRQKQGRSFVLKTSKKFEEYFDLPKKEAIRELFKNIKDEEVKEVQKTIDDVPKVQIYEEKDEDKVGNLETYHINSEQKKKSIEPSNEEFYEKEDEVLEWSKEEPVKEHTKEQTQNTKKTEKKESEKIDSIKIQKNDLNEAAEVQQKNADSKNQEKKEAKETFEIKHKKRNIVPGERELDDELEDMLEEKPEKKEDEQKQGDEQEDES